MGPKIDPKVEYTIKALSKVKTRGKDIQNILKESGNVIALSTIYNIINSEGKRRSAVASGRPVPKNNYLCKKKNKTLLRKIDRLTDQENPPSQRTIGNKSGISHQ